MSRLTALALAASAALFTPSLAVAAEDDGTLLPGDHRESLRATIDEVSQRKFLHGFRLGYLYLANVDAPANGADPESPTLAEKYGIRSAHQFVIGYEVTWRMIGHDWLNVLFVTNALVAGLEQSKVFPSMNALIGFEISEVAQLGVGVNVAPEEYKPAHMIIAAGWTPRVGDFYTPVHAYLVPDVDGAHRMGLTVGVNW
ncbi:hypothetical protein L6R52_03590 [Myxococcota bacterium]|nr:hypothetical protein [Myxococcota bacterium]